MISRRRPFRHLAVASISAALTVAGIALSHLV